MPKETVATKPTMSSFLSEETDFDELLRSLSFEQESVQYAAARQPLLFLKAARLRVQTMRSVAKAKAALDQIDAEAAREYRDNCAANNTKPTDKNVREVTVSDPNVIAAEAVLATALAKEELGKLCVEAYKHRRDAIRVIAEAQLVEGHSQFNQYAQTPEKIRLDKDAADLARRKRRAQQEE